MGSSPALPSEIYVVFCGAIDQNSTQQFFKGLVGATTQDVKQIHILFQSTGGTVSDGIALYNFFRSLSVELTLYNAGQVSSAALTAYLGAKNRKVSEYASFMIHRTTSPAIALEGRKLRAMTESVFLDDERTEAILRKHLVMPDEKWAALEHNLWLTAKDAVKYGVADEIAEFAPPLGTRLFKLV
jgi:ATP-dependent Clp protease protease subunit